MLALFLDILEKFSDIIVAIIVGLAAPLLVKCVEFRLEDKKQLLNEQRKARKELIDLCIGHASANPDFYANEDFIFGIFPQIKPDLSKLNKQLVREIEEMAEKKPRKSLKDREQIRTKFTDALGKLKKKWKLT